MGYTKLLLPKPVSASFVAKLAFMFLLSMQSISIAHDLSHHQHEASEFCEVLNAFGANKVVIPSFVINLDSYSDNGQVNSNYSSLVDRPFAFVQRSRSPPTL